MDPATQSLAHATAVRIVDEFGRSPFPGAFPKLDRSKIAFGLVERLAKPSLINQGGAGLCTTAALVYNLARTRPVEYVRAVTELFDRGRTKINDWIIEPCDDLRFYKPPASAKIPQADWIIMASIRDSENWFFDYQRESDEGGTDVSETVDWLKKAGYTDVQEDRNLFANSTAANLQKADELYAKDYQVILSIDDNLLKGERATLSQSNHAVALASKISADFTQPKSLVYMKVFSWGEIHSIPLEDMTLDDFTDYYYGYVAAKF